ncbi:hypothetical protein AGMMS50276_00540 [Synergistales bacterium]|nr:hypothetical protein AGMMS50276_00540 [Synergistales bacterium]
MKSMLKAIVIAIFLVALLAFAFFTKAPISETGFTVYFIDVGQADSAVIVCDGHAMMIDGGNAADSDLVYTFLKKHNINHLDYMIGTHAHEDHIGGLPGALNYAKVDAAYCPVTTYNSKAFGNFVKYLAQQGVKITKPKPGDVISLGSASVKFLAPQKAYGEPNNTSIVVKITYGKTDFLFTGDAERESEADILAAGYNLRSTVLKVGHHASKTSTTYPFLREIMPKYAVVSVGRGNSYGHPDPDTMSRLRDAEVTVYRTDLHGDVTVTSDGNDVSFKTQKNAGPVPPRSDTKAQKTQESSSLAVESSYIGNANTKVFHRPKCSSVGQMNPKNRVALNSREDAIARSFKPCGRCKP